MADEWIKMRPSLLTSPKVNGIARILEKSRPVSAKLTTGYVGHMADIVDRNVMRNVTVCALLTVWGAANEHTKDGVFKNTDLDDISDIAGIPTFGDAMAAVGWAIYDDNDYSVTLPNFNEYNTCGADRAKEKNRERQAKYRERQRKLAEENNVTDNVTNNVTNNDREEKRREEKNNKHTGAKSSRFVPPSVSEVQEYLDDKGITDFTADEFVDHYAAANWMRGKTKITSWKHCVGTWMRNRKPQQPRQVEELL